jgi:hypothetical protein
VKVIKALSFTRTIKKWPVENELKNVNTAVAHN